MQCNCLNFTHQVEQICLYDGALIILRILQALQCGDSLTPDLRLQAPSLSNIKLNV